MATDLLGLIEISIESLRRCIDFFDAAKHTNGVTELASVLAEINRYLERVDEDPLLKIASIDREGIADRLHGIEDDLAAIITDFDTGEEQVIEA